MRLTIAMLNSTQTPNFTHQLKIMSNESSEAIRYKNIRYIKLGGGGSGIDAACIGNGELYIGFRSNQDDYFELAKAGKWEAYKKRYLKLSNKLECPGESARQANATKASNQVKAFFEAQPDTLWITFHGGYLHYGVVDPCIKPMQRNELGGCTRIIHGGWKSSDATGKKLEVEKLAGHLTRIQMFRGTSFKLEEENKEYLLRRLSGTVPQYITDLDAARESMKSAIAEAITKLQPKDFEILVETIFSQSWRRIGKSGGNEKFVDITFEDPLKNIDTIAVQVKSETRTEEIDRYLESSDHIDRYKHFYFAYHTGAIDEERYRSWSKVSFIGRDKLSNLVIDSGLIHWLREKTS